MAAVITEDKQFREAGRVATQSLAINQDQCDALSIRGSALNHLDRYAEALDALNRAIVLNPNSDSSHANCAEVMNNLGRPTDN